MSRKNTATQFWTKVNKADGCWLWGGAKTDLGYGIFYFCNKAVSAHRYAYESRLGPIPNGLVLDHLCRVPACVNPDHLEAVTQRENVLRGIAPAAIQAKKTHCLHGHELTPDNVYSQPSNPNRRACRKCSVAWHKAYNKVRIQRRAVAK